MTAPRGVITDSLAWLVHGVGMNEAEDRRRRCREVQSCRHIEGCTMARRRKYGFSWSWKRALGLSAAKGKLSRKLGVPFTQSGRRQKVGRMLGCSVLVALVLAAA